MHLSRALLFQHTTLVHLQTLILGNIDGSNGDAGVQYDVPCRVEKSAGHLVAERVLLVPVLRLKWYCSRLRCRCAGFVAAYKCD